MRIFVGVDGSHSSTQALRWAAHEATLHGAQLHAVNAITLNTGFGDVWMVADPTVCEDAAQQGLDAAIAAAFGDQDITIERHVVQGSPAAVLIDLADEDDMIVVGSHGHGGFVGSIVGSVSHRVATHAPCPVVIVRGSKD